jgi:hypothetical protein
MLARLIFASTVICFAETLMGACPSGTYNGMNQRTVTIGKNGQNTQVTKILERVCVGQSSGSITWGPDDHGDNNDEWWAVFALDVCPFGHTPAECTIHEDKKTMPARAHLVIAGACPATSQLNHVCHFPYSAQLKRGGVTLGPEDPEIIVDPAGGGGPR